MSRVMSRLFKWRGVSMLWGAPPTGHDSAAHHHKVKSQHATLFCPVAPEARPLRPARLAQQWRRPEPKPGYDAVIVGGGGHGLGAAYYLAKEHGISNIAVLEKGWIGGGNTGRNTTIIRSNYLYDESAALYDHALKLWEGAVARS